MLTLNAADEPDPLRGFVADWSLVTIVDRLGTQTDAPLSFSQEIADLRAEPSVSNVRIYRDDKLTDQ